MPLHFSSQKASPAVKVSEAIVSHVLTEIDGVCLPGDLPKFIAVDLSGLTVGHPLPLSDVTMPAGVTAVQAKENPVLVVATVKGSGAEVEDAGGAAAAPAKK